MSWKPCLNCGKEISPDATACPDCGHPNKRYRGFEWRSEAEIAGIPMIHVAFGRHAETGRWHIAKGIIAIGQFGIGLVAVTQFGVGLLFGLGQFMAGTYVIAQFGAALRFCLAQFGAAPVVVAQLGFGDYVLAQRGWGQHLWTTQVCMPEAVEYFQQLGDTLSGLF